MNKWSKVTAGQKLRIPAAAYNLWTETAAIVRQQQQNIGFERTPAGPERILVRNDTGAALGRAAVVGLDGVIWTADDDVDQYLESPVWSAVEPSVVGYDGHHVDGRFAVLAGPLPAGAVGPAYASGVCRVQVHLEETWHWRADIAHGLTDYLKSYPGGAAVILDIDRTTTGTKWAWVRLGINPYVWFQGDLDEDLDPSSSATFSIWQLGLSGWEDSGLDATVYAPRYLPSAIDSGKRIRAGWSAQERRLVLEAAEC
jgi:hypothetical protein